MWLPSRSFGGSDVAASFAMSLPAPSYIWGRAPSWRPPEDPVRVWPGLDQALGAPVLAASESQPPISISAPLEGTSPPRRVGLGWQGAYPKNRGILEPSPGPYEGAYPREKR